VRKFSLLGLIAIGSVFFTSLASATPVTGEANIAGTVNVNTSGVFFTNTSVQSPNTGSFAGTTSVTLKDLVGAPTSGAVSIPAFATFTTASGPVTFDLTNIMPGVGSAGACTSNTVGNVCTPVFPSGPSPFTLIQTAPGQVTISLALTGDAYAGTAATGTSPNTPFSFSTQNTLPGTITGILAAVNTNGGFTNSYSATLSATSAIPEPASCLLMGAGLLAAGLISRRKIRS
jgi:hypothetical protein